MSYIDGFVTAVPQQNKQTYLDHARAALALFKDHGATRMVENWGEDVPQGKVTDFHRSVQKKDDEAVLLSWIEWPSKQARDAGMKALMEDPRMKTLQMPFDGQRMIYGGFAPMLERGQAGKAAYVNGFVIPVPIANRDAYLKMATETATVFEEYGATRIVEGWGDDVPVGKMTDFRRAVDAKDGENMIFSWIEWPSKMACDEGWKKLMADPRMQRNGVAMPFDGQRMIYGGFATILDD